MSCTNDALTIQTCWKVFIIKKVGTNNNTKRAVFYEIAKVFNALGFTGLVTCRAKMIMHAILLGQINFFEFEVSGGVFSFTEKRGK